MTEDIDDGPGLDWYKARCHALEVQARKYERRIDGLEGRVERLLARKEELLGQLEALGVKP